MKVIIDTNILINVLLSPSRKSASFKVLELCLTQKLQPQIGEALFQEFEDVANRKRIIEKSTFSPKEIENILDGFFSVCRWNKVHYLWRPNLSDEGDNHLVDLAVASNAKYLITQNVKDLKSGELSFDFKVITPEKFLEEVL